MNAPMVSTSKPLSRVELREIAGRIHQRTAQAIIENGRDLLKAKDALAHGEFLAWLERDVQISERTAQRAMQAAQWVDTLPETKSVTVTDLPAKEIYLLSAPSTPAKAQEWAIGRLAQGLDVHHADLLKVIKEELGHAAGMRDEPTDEGCRQAIAEAVAEGPPADVSGEAPQGGGAEVQTTKRRRSRKEIERDVFFDGRLSQLEVVAGVDFDLPAPKLNAEDANKAITQIKKAEAGLRRLRREIERQHPNVAGEADPKGDTPVSSQLPWQKEGGR